MACSLQPTVGLHLNYAIKYRLIRVLAGLDCILNDDIKVRLGAEDGDGEDR